MIVFLIQKDDQNFKCNECSNYKSDANEALHQFCDKPLLPHDIAIWLNKKKCSEHHCLGSPHYDYFYKREWKDDGDTAHQGCDFWNQNDSFLNLNDCASKRPLYNMRSKIPHKFGNLVLICESQSNQRRPCLTWDLVLHLLTRWFPSIIGHK
jgi:hypothetical protein